MQVIYLEIDLDENDCDLELDIKACIISKDFGFIFF